MSDSLSPENLGYAFFSAYETHIYGKSKETILRDWNCLFADDKSRWAQCADSFSEHLKRAKADS
jgi:hypothetical protein